MVGATGWLNRNETSTQWSWGN